MIKKYISILLICFSLIGCEKNNANIDTTTQGYRSIIIADYNGQVDVTRSEGDRLGAYLGLNLFTGDVVQVYDSSNLTLDVDFDKHLFAEENTRFWLEADGNDNNTKTRIHLEDGSVLCRIENKLDAEEYFEVVTSSATMSVKGTVFRISKYGANNGDNFIFVEVFDGIVYTKLNYSNDSIDVTAGRSALIKEGTNFASPKLINEDQIDKDTWDNRTIEFIVNKNSKIKNSLLTIPYLRLPESTVDFLIQMSDDGEQLVISKDFLNAIRKEDSHTFMEISYTPATCLNEGQRVLECKNCHTRKYVSLDKKEHNIVIDEAVAATCDTTGLTEGSHCADCNEVLIPQMSVKALGHSGDPCVRCGKVSVVQNSHTHHNDVEAIDGNEVSTNKKDTNNSNEHTFNSITITNNANKKADKNSSTTILLGLTAVVGAAVVGFVIYKFLSNKK